MRNIVVGYSSYWYKTRKYLPNTELVEELRTRSFSPVFSRLLIFLYIRVHFFHLCGGGERWAQDGKRLQRGGASHDGRQMRVDARRPGPNQ